MMTCLIKNKKRSIPCLSKLLNKYSILFFLIFAFHSSYGHDKMKSPHKLKIGSKSETYGYGQNKVLNFYQKWLSPVKGGDTCPMHPSCSQYAKISFEKYSWYHAFPKSTERILRCGNELYLYPIIFVKNRYRWYDPAYKPDSINE